MLISTAQQTIKLNVWETRRELAYALANCDGGSVLLGEDIDEAREFYSAVVYSKWPKSNTGQFGIGICSEGHNLMPHLLLTSNRDLLLFGFNSQVAGISIYERRRCFTIGLDSLFHSFFYLSEKKIVLILHEIGVVAMAEEGNELWRYSKDIITDFNVEQDTLSLNFMDYPAVILEVSSGQRH